MMSVSNQKRRASLAAILFLLSFLFLPFGGPPATYATGNDQKISLTVEPESENKKVFFVFNNTLRLSSFNYKETNCSSGRVLERTLLFGDAGNSVTVQKETFEYDSFLSPDPLIIRKYAFWDGRYCEDDPFEVSTLKTINPASKEKTYSVINNRLNLQFEVTGDVSSGAFVRTDFHQSVPISTAESQPEFKKLNGGYVIKGREIKTTPDREIVIREGLFLANEDTGANDFGGTTTFYVEHLVVGSSLFCRYKRIFRDGLGREMVVEIGETQGDTLEEQALKFRPKVAAYNYYYLDGRNKNGNPRLGIYNIPDLTVATVWGESDTPNGIKIDNLSSERSGLIAEIAQILYNGEQSSLVRFWKGRATKEYQADAETLSFKELCAKYDLSGDRANQIDDKLRAATSLADRINALRNDKSNGEFVHKLYRATGITEDRRIRNLVQKGVACDALEGQVGERYIEIFGRFRESKINNQPLLEAIMESYEELIDNRGTTVTVLTGYNKINPTDGFIAEDATPLFIEFRLYYPPFVEFTYDQLKQRIDEIEKELKKFKFKEGDKSPPYVKSFEFLTKERQLLRRAMSNQSKKPNGGMGETIVLYLPNVLLFHAGIMSESYTYEYKPEK